MNAVTIGYQKGPWRHPLHNGGQGAFAQFVLRIPKKAKRCNELEGAEVDVILCKVA